MLLPCSVLCSSVAVSAVLCYCVSFYFVLCGCLFVFVYFLCYEERCLLPHLLKDISKANCRFPAEVQRYVC